jgi:hypothetical protein
MRGVDIDSVKHTYDILEKSLNILIRLRSPSRSAMILNNVEEFISVIDSILNINYPDKNDPDIEKTNNELIEMKDRILELSSQLPL